MEDYPYDYEGVERFNRSAEKIIHYSNSELEKIERVCNAFEKMFDAESRKEAHQKFRVLFQRAAKEHLPFIVYSIYMSVVGITAFININKVTGWFLIAYLVALVLIMAIPAIILFKSKSERKKK